jgi:hypothetical protein
MWVPRLFGAPSVPLPGVDVSLTRACLKFLPSHLSLFVLVCCAFPLFPLLRQEGPEPLVQPYDVL